MTSQITWQVALEQNPALDLLSTRIRCSLLFCVLLGSATQTSTSQEYRDKPGLQMAYSSSVSSLLASSLPSLLFPPISIGSLFGFSFVLLAPVPSTAF